MDWDDLESANRDAFADVTVDYTPAGGSTVEDCAVVWDTEMDADLVAADGDLRTERARAILSADDVAAPRQGDTVTNGDDAWSVEAVRELPGGDHELRLVRTIPEERTRESHRLRR